MLASSPNPTLTLSDFLALTYIEDSPAWEYVNGTITQKPMPQGQHSQLQYRLCEAINQVAEPSRFAYALPELRCTLPERSLVPDICVFRWQRIPLTSTGEIANQFETFADWVIEILSPQQNMSKVMKNILYCLDQGSELGWLINPEERSILVLLAQKAPQCYLTDDPESNNAQEILPVLSGLDLTLTAEQIFSWLKFSR